MLRSTYEEIARIVERKQGTAAVHLGTEGGPLADGFVAFGGVGSYVNKACGLGLQRAVADEELDELVRFFESRGVEPKVETAPFAHRSLFESLADRGFTLREFEDVLARDLTAEAVRALRQHPVPEGVRIESVDLSDESALLEHIRVSGSGFTPEGEQLSQTFLDAGLRAAKMPGYDGFVAKVGDEVVGAAGCESSDGVTSLFGASVKPAYRRRGIQQALIAARLIAGAERGSTLGVIISGPGIPTERNAARLGFEMAYSRAVLVKRGPGLVPSP